MSAWIQTFSGLVMHPLDAKPEEICIEDIAHALSNMCRFTGHTREFYSVAEHSVRVSWAVPHYAALSGLMHDATEAYLVDLSSPVKRDESMVKYRVAELELDKVIRTKFGLPEQPKSVHEADRTLLFTEARDLLGPAPKLWTDPAAAPLKGRIVPWSPWEARERFLGRYAELMLQGPHALQRCGTCGGAKRFRPTGTPLVRALWKAPCCECEGDWRHARWIGCPQPEGSR